MSSTPIILLGGGGHCKSCIEVIRSTRRYDIAGILDVKEKVGEEVLGHRIIGSDDELDAFRDRATHFLITTGQIKSAALRIKLFNKAIAAGFKPATVISAYAIVSEYACIDEGSIVMHGAVINAGVSIGRNCIINTKANIEHDTVISDHVHVSTNVVLNGDCAVGDETFIGSGTVVIQGMKIGERVVIGAGSLVNKPCLHAGIYAGNPIRALK